MKKILQILFALILILILTYIAFINTSTTIQKDLISKAKTILKDNNRTDIGVEMEGKGLNIKRVLILTGSVSTYKEKVQVEILTQNIEGVGAVKNQITLTPRVKPVQNFLESVVVVPNEVKLEKKTPPPSKPISTPTLRPTSTPEPISKPTLVVEKVQKIRVEVSTPMPTESIDDTNKSKINIPTVVSVPKVIKNNVSVPVAVKAVSAPIAIEAIEAVELKTKGVEK